MVLLGSSVLFCFLPLQPDNLHAFTGYAMADISPCVADLHQLYISAESHPHQAIREKYKSSR